MRERGPRSLQKNIIHEDLCGICVSFGKNDLLANQLFDAPNQSAGCWIGIQPHHVKSRHINPCGYAAWNPPELAAFGQEKMTGAFIAHSPDYVIELFVDYGEYGETIFGQEKRFGLEVQQWIDAHYQPALLIGHDWLKDSQFGIKILKKNGS